ncbi:MAG: PilZ domain-containing protein, partial [Candidatus Omnitrophica bacterium]|nr:PilZ domain-containing protein [Candidatus Omnitrophota bacterium]
MVKKEVQDRRKFPRLFAYHLAKYNLSAPIKSDKLIMASISDISAGGARLRLSQNLPVSSLIQLFINFPQLPQPLISIAKVVWSRKLKKAGIYESGLQFVDIEDSGKQKISARVEAIKKLILAVLVLFLAKTTFCFAEVIPPAMAARQGVVYAALRDVEMSRTLQQEESLQKAESSA